jgi:formylglycine-generating enzyme required for sulfatase activity
MAHDVFISHSARDKPYADAVCAKLESRNIRCWIAPRDIRPGMTWAGAIIEAVDGARVMLLLFSSHANSSSQITREVEYAVQKQIVIVPVKVEDVIPTGDFAYFLATPHWLDAIAPPFEQHLDRIADSVKFWLEPIHTGAATTKVQPTEPVRNPASAPPASTLTAAARKPKWIVPAIVVLTIALVSTAAFFGARHYLAQPRGSVLDERTSQALDREHAAKQSAGRIFRDCADCPQMVEIPAGSFTMGSPSSEAGHDSDEEPLHLVTIGYSFAVSRYPVTRDEYGRFARENHASDEWQNPSFPQTEQDPVVQVSWNDANAYAAWLSKKTGHGYRLLSEAEYEYAERAGTSTAYWWGDTDADLCRYAIGGPCNHHGTVPVGSYPANAFGLYDMAGNAWEWTADCSNKSYAGAPNDGAVWKSGNCDQPVQRGGSWHSRSLRSANRSRDSKEIRSDHDGFRVARTL